MTEMVNRDFNDSFKLLNKHICKVYLPNDDIHITETANDGIADITFTPHLPCLHICNCDKHHFPLLAQGRCADHILLLYDVNTNQWELHVFELTRTISHSLWSTKIIPQLEGALGDAFAISGVLRIPSFSKTYLHCGYRFNKSETSPIELRAPLGMPIDSDWLTKPINLPVFSDMTTISAPIKLDPDTGKAQLKLG